MRQGPTKHPPFSGQLTRVTREGEQGSVAFTAHTVEELRRKLAEASAALDAQVHANNTALLDAVASFEERQVKVYTAALAQLRREIGVPASPDGGAFEHANDTAGPIHQAENP